MKHIMISTFLIILAMTFSCAEKDSIEEVKTEMIEVESVQEVKVENETPEIASDNGEVEIEKEVSDHSSKEIDKKISKGEKQVKRELPAEKQVERSDKIETNVNRTEEKVIFDEKKKEVSKKAVEGTKVKENKKVVMAKPDHSVFNGLLQSHVTSKGVVDYKGMNNDIGNLDTYLKDLSANTVASGWSKNEKLAYWINAYNAFTIKLILDNYPVNSIQDINKGKPWDKTWIKLGGKTYSLNQIENDIIRPEFGEPRIHFAVNCAAQSCPPLANKAFTAENLNSLLEKQTKAFINNTRFNTIGEKSVTISKIFDWYGEDFGDKIAFLNKYADTKIGAKAKVGYSEYDWGLNNK